MRTLMAMLIVSAALSSASIAAFKAINDHVERTEAREADAQMNRVLFSMRHRPESLGQ
jgi:hypothetical protein